MLKISSICLWEGGCQQHLMLPQCPSREPRGTLLMQLSMVLHGVCFASTGFLVVCRRQAVDSCEWAAGWRQLCHQLSPSPLVFTFVRAFASKVWGS